MGPGLPTNFDCRAFMSIWHVRDTWLLCRFLPSQNASLRAPPARPRTRPSLVDVSAQRPRPETAPQDRSSAPGFGGPSGHAPAFAVPPGGFSPAFAGPVGGFPSIAGPPAGFPGYAGFPAGPGLTGPPGIFSGFAFPAGSPGFAGPGVFPGFTGSPTGAPGFASAPGSAPAAPPNLVQERPASLVLQVSSPPPDLPLVAFGELQLVYGYWRDQ
jgi:hypothetical protein